MEINVIFEAKSPITHNKGIAGNETLLNTISIISKSGNPISVPCLSGNALRHSLVRAPLASDIIRRGGDKIKANVPLLHFLFSGGALTKGSIGVNTAEINHLKDAVPFIALLGGCSQSDILEGSLKVSPALLIARETDHVTGALSPLCARQLTSKYQYTRVDPSDKIAKVTKEPNNAGDLQMIYSGQAISAGAKFSGRFFIDEFANDATIGAFVWALRHAGTVGGSARIGHGVVQAFIDIDEAEATKYLGAYEAHMSERIDEVVDALDSMFQFREPAKKGKK